LPCDIHPVEHSQYFSPIAVAARLERQAFSLAESKANPGISQSVPRHQLVDLASLGNVRLQEFKSRREVEEQILDLNQGPARRTRALRRQGLAGHDAHPGPGILCSHPGCDRQPGNGPYRCQSLAPKSQAFNMKEIIRHRQLAGCMPGHSEGQLFGRYAAPVIRHFDQPPAGLLDADRNFSGAGIQSVLDQLLNHRGRALDDLSSSDLRGNFGG
jgi:hypothetical protein